MWNKLLIDDYPIQVLPKLAKEVGLNEAIFLQQLHYWINGKAGKKIEGKNWVYNTYKDWEDNFPFWSNATIRRTISSCEKQNLILVGNYNRAGFDKTKWYSVNYDEITRVSKRVAQNEQTSCSKRANGDAQNEQTNTIDYTQTTSKTTSNSSQQSLKRYDDDSPYIHASIYMFEHVKKLNPGNKEPDFQKWADDVRKTIELDKRPIEEYKKLLDWAHTDKFWEDKILSPKKFREKYDQLLIQMNKSNRVGKRTEYDPNAKIDEELGF